MFRPAGRRGIARRRSPALVCFFLTMPAGIDVFLSQVASNVRVSVHHKGGLVYQMPFAYGTHTLSSSRFVLVMKCSRLL